MNDKRQSTMLCINFPPHLVTKNAFYGGDRACVPTRPAAAAAAAGGGTYIHSVCLNFSAPKNNTVLHTQTFKKLF